MSKQTTELAPEEGATQNPVRVPPTFLSLAKVVAEDNGFRITDHAIRRMWERRIDPEAVIRVAKDPVTSYRGKTSKEDKRIYRRCWGPGPFGKSIYVCIEQSQGAIVTVGWKKKEDEQWVKSRK